MLRQPGPRLEAIDDAEVPKTVRGILGPPGLNQRWVIEFRDGLVKAVDADGLNPEPVSLFWGEGKVSVIAGP